MRSILVFLLLSYSLIYAVDIKKLEKEANAGDRKAQYNLAEAYFHGDGTKVNHLLAVKWFRMAATNGDSVAMNNLGLMYEKGLGVKSSLELAFKLYTKSAGKEYPQAQYNLGRIYYNGIPGLLEPDYEQAYVFYKKAAENDIAVAQYNLAILCFNGQGCKKDKSIAEKWFSKAAENGYTKAEDILKKYY